LKNKIHCLKQLDITKAATMMDGWTGAEIHNVINLAAIETVRK
jgi:ATP-dependent Zn protease